MSILTDTESNDAPRTALDEIAIQKAFDVINRERMACLNSKSIGTGDWNERARGIYEMGRLHFERENGKTARWFNEGPFIETVAAALADAHKAGMPQWQPIETAPLNESVLIYIPAFEHYGTGVCRGLKKKSVSEKQIWMTTGWHHGVDLCLEDNQPTHWMPLLQPPC